MVFLAAGRLPNRALRLRGFRQQLVEMAAPAGRVLSLAPAARGRVIKDAFDPTADPRGSLGLFGPDWFKHPHDESDINRLSWQHSEYRIDVGFERRWPLLRVNRVFPPGLVRVDVPLRALAKRDSLRRLDQFGIALGLARVEWIDAFENHPASFYRSAPRFSERD